MIMQELTLIEGTIGLSLLLLVIALFLGLYRLARGPSLPDRVVALNLMSSLAIGLISAYCILTKQPVLLDVMLVVALISFLATIAFARLLEKGIS